MGSLAAIFGSSEEEEKGHDSEKLMDLYWNRAELKKAYADARNEHFRLKDLVKKEEGATARVQQKLDHIEDLLQESESGFSVLALYQLRSLAIACENRLSLFSEQLKQQREKKQHRDMMAAWEGECEQDRAAIEEQLVVVRDDMRAVSEKRAALELELEGMGFFRKIFKGRSLRSEIDQLDQRLFQSHSEEQGHLEELARIDDREMPETQGLTIGAKRSINLLIISYAQQLFLQFDDSAFAMMVKESRDRSAGGVSYGSIDDCQSILQQVRKQASRMERNTEDAAVLQKRAMLIGETAVFRNDDEVVPISASTSTVFDLREDGGVRQTDVAILGENYWAISDVLSR